MRADWTPCGALTSGSTALPRDATNRTIGGVTMTCTPRAEHQRSEPPRFAGRQYGSEPFASHGNAAFGDIEALSEAARGPGRHRDVCRRPPSPACQGNVP